MRRRSSGLRCLPALAFLAAFMIGARVDEAWRALSVPGGPSVSARAMAQASAPGAAQPTPAPKDGARASGAKEAPTVKTPPESAGISTAESKAGAGAKTTEGARGAAATPSATEDKATNAGSASEPVESQGGDRRPLAELTDAEIDVLHRLAERRRELEARSADLDLREQMIKLAEKRLEAKIAELAALQVTIDGGTKKLAEAEEARLKSLVKVYESMKPKDAARIFEQLDMTVLLNMLERMREQKTAPILAAMDPVKAKSATAELAARQSLPGRPAGAAAQTPALAR
ncbi:MAG: hypothetical protein ACREGL_02095 [Alphaproteobacteria bacterium]